MQVDKCKRCGKLLRRNNYTGYCHIVGRACIKWAYQNDPEFRALVQEGNRRWWKKKYYSDKEWRDHRNKQRRARYSASNA